MATVLLSALGHSPGAVTGTVDALVRSGQIVDEVITFSTSAPVVLKGSVELLKYEFKHYPAYQGRINYQNCTIESTELRTSDDHRKFSDLVRDEMLELRQNQAEVIVSLAGGRKTMSATMARMAQLYGARKLCHVLVPSEVESAGELNKEMLPRLKTDNGLAQVSQYMQRALHPDEKESELVEIPFIQVTTQNGQIELVYRGEIEGDIAFFEANPDIIAHLDEESKRNLIGYVFEVKLREYLWRQGYQVRPGRTKFKIGPEEGDIDVFATKEGKTLVCECKCITKDQPDRYLRIEKKNPVKELVKELDYVRTHQLPHPDAPLEGWIVTNLFYAEEAIWDHVEKHGVRLMTSGHLPKNWENSLNWSISRVEPMVRQP